MSMQFAKPNNVYIIYIYTHRGLYRLYISTYKIYEKINWFNEYSILHFWQFTQPKILKHILSSLHMFHLTFSKIVQEVQRISVKIGANKAPLNFEKYL